MKFLIAMSIIGAIMLITRLCCSDDEEYAEAMAAIVVALCFFAFLVASGAT